MLIVEKIGYIVNSIRESGEVIISNHSSSIDLGCDYVLGCGCDTVATAADGTYTYTKLSPYYYFGNVYELQRVLDDKNIRQKRKYPAVILQQPFINKVLKNLRDQPTLTLFVVNNASTESSYSVRYKGNFKDVLYPLWNDLNKAFLKSGLVINFEILEVNEHPNFSSNKVISDCWDLLEVKIKILFNECEKPFCEKLIYN